MEIFVASFVSVTVAPSTTAPLASCTTPVTREAVPWARATPPKSMERVTSKERASGLCFLIMGDSGFWFRGRSCRTTVAQSDATGRTDG